VEWFKQQECLPSRHEALNSNPNVEKKKMDSIPDDIKTLLRQFNTGIRQAYRLTTQNQESRNKFTYL
jgi:hypothetical protein